MGISVSIPNGMEFYSISRAIVEQSATGFNSQRDGILLEFLSEKLTLFGFNSQRDGILPDWAGEFYSGAYVSIPNGMEFYQKDV